jgi:hypothetical protein
MAAQAAHLVDCVLPAVPIRQFVLSFPFELSLLAATKPEVLRALARIHAEELARHYKSVAKKSGEVGKLHAGAVTFVQRFGSSLNLHVHLHTCALDGVYVEDDDGEAPRFVSTAPPSRAELYVLTERVTLRVMTWLRKRGYAKDDDHASTRRPTAPSPMCSPRLLRSAAPSRTSRTTPPNAKARPNPSSASRRSRHAPRLQPLPLWAPTAILARALSYLARRAHLLPREEVGAAHLALSHHDSRVECIARLCALVPPPRYPLTRFHGVLAPRAKLRARIVPKLPESLGRGGTSPSSPCRGQDEPRARSGERPPPRDKSGPVIPAAQPVSATTLARSIDGAGVPMPNLLSAKHLGRIAGGLLYADTSNVPWATLLGRTSTSTSRPALDAAAGSRSALSSATTTPRAEYSTRCQPRRALRRRSTRPSHSNLRSRDRPRTDGDVRPPPDACPEFQVFPSQTVPEHASPRLPVLDHAAPCARTSYAPPRAATRSSPGLPRARP